MLNAHQGSCELFHRIPYLRVTFLYICFYTCFFPPVIVITFVHKQTCPLFSFPKGILGIFCLLPYLLIAENTRILIPVRQLHFSVAYTVGRLHSARGQLSLSQNNYHNNVNLPQLLAKQYFRIDLEVGETNISVNVSFG